MTSANLMDFNNLNYSNVESKFQNSKPGLYCHFVPLNEKIGIKLYPEKKWRDIAYKNQKNAAKLGLGPNVYTTKSLFVDGKYYFGYLTEIVELYDKKFYRNGEENHEYLSSNEFVDVKDKYPGKYKNLENHLKKLGMDDIAEDLHNGNLGWKNGKLICIDFL